VSDQTQSPEPSNERPPADRPAALEPDSPADSTPTEIRTAPEPPSALGDADVLAVDSPPPVTAPPVAPPPGSLPPPPTPDWAPAGGSSSPFDERPELAVGAAFAGGLVVALIFKRLAR
jgi:DNA polymerase-3 subunit gamma/tau